MKKTFLIFTLLIMDKIVYIAIDNGIDGKEKDNILYASFDEIQFNELLNRDKSRNFRTPHKIIINVAVARREALAKLNGIDRLVLGLPDWINEKNLRG